jgi:hypothetical protein
VAGWMRSPSTDWACTVRPTSSRVFAFGCLFCGLPRLNASRGERPQQGSFLLRPANQQDGAVADDDGRGDGSVEVVVVRCDGQIRSRASRTGG